MNNEDVLLERSERGDIQILRFVMPSIKDTVAVLLIEDEFRRILEHAATQTPRVCIDFSCLKLLPTTVLAKMVSFWNELKKIDGQLVLCGLTSPVKAVFKSTGFDRLFRVVPDLESAVASLKKRSTA